MASGPYAPGSRPPGRLDPSDLMTASEAANLLGCSRRQVYLLVEKGALPGARRLGHSVLVVRPVLERWLLTGSIESRSA